MKELTIVGGGPAGITAGIYAARKNLNTLLLTKDFIGQLGNAGVIENWPGEKSIRGPELLTDLEEHLRNYDIQIKEERVVEINKEKDFFKIESEEAIYRSEAVIVATGRNPRPLEIPGEKDYVGKGVSYCVTCDGALFKNKTVAVVGGGNSGLEGALELSDYVRRVTVLEIADKLQGDEFLVEKVKGKNNIEILTRVEPKEIKGDSFVSSLRYEDLDKKEAFSIDVDGIFVLIGSIPTTDMLDNSVDYNDEGEIAIDFKTCRTSVDGLFAAGDVTGVRDKQVVVSAGEGCKALISAYDYIKNNR